MNVDLGRVGRELKLTAESVQRTVELLDEGNTVPFVTRYRKDQTGGLDEEQIRAVQVRVNQMRQVAERKQTILKSIEAQGQLTPELTNRINNTHSPKRLEDIYLPFKPKKQTLATAARERGLLPLALEIENGVELDLQQRATELVDPAKQVDSIDDVFRGVQHILAERISERPDVRAALRELFRKTGVVVSKAANDATPTRGGTDHPADAAPAESTPTESTPADTAPTDATSTDATPTESTPTNPAPTDAPPTDATPTDATPTDATPTDATSTDATSTDATSTDATPTESTPTNPAPTDAPPTDATPTDAASTDVTPTDTAPTDATPTDAATTDATSTDATAADTAPPDATATESTPPDESAAAAATTPSEETPPVVDPTPSSASPGANAGANVEKPASAAPVMAAAKVVRSSKPTESASQARRRKKRERAENAFKDYFDFREPVNKAPPHRILALNRGERAKVLRVRVECDSDALLDLANKTVLPDEHAHRDIVQASIKDAVIRLVLPSLERELRRELTERAELHAVEVFVRNLRKLLLQPPVHNRTVLAIDPGFKSGCKLAVVDCFGRVLATDVMHIVGKADRLQRSKKRLAALVRKHSVDVIAIGNGAACRETEQLVSEVIESGSVHAELAFVIVNEAGASVYSTSPIGREELPDHEAIQRSAISLARRLLDPLSELVKINPANIGVGLYQHDVRAKHLRESLDAVVESCVNYVGVNVNTASPALLGYVSGLNQLKARRLYEYRLEHGPFRNRQQFKDVPGFGDATFVQAAGFLKITDGDNPLDATWIHPESYDAARVLLTKLDSSETELQTMIEPVAAPPPAEPTPTPAPSTQAVSETAPAETALVETAQV